MKIVLDTNVLLVSFSRNSPLYWIWQSLLHEKFSLCITTEILLEYEEIISRHLGYEIAQSVMDALLELPNLVFVQSYYHWGLIVHDIDDNKFVDCAVACNATYIVSEDKHFRILKEIPFPKVNVIGIAAFEKLIAN